MISFARHLNIKAVVALYLGKFLAWNEHRYKWIYPGSLKTCWFGGVSKFVACTTASVAATSGPSDTPISTAAPNLPGGKVANTAPPGPFFQDFKPPFPTDACKFFCKLSHKRASNSLTLPLLHRVVWLFGRNTRRVRRKAVRIFSSLMRLQLIRFIYQQNCSWPFSLWVCYPKHFYYFWNLQQERLRWDIHSPT
jgi:hypothetical protein